MSAALMLHHLKGANIEDLAILTGYFTINGTSAPDGVRGRRFTVSRQAKGQFRIKFDNLTWKLLIPLGNPGLALAGTDKDYHTHWGALSPSASGGATADAIVTVGTVDDEPDNGIVSFAFAAISTGNDLTIVT